MHDTLRNITGYGTGHGPYLSIHDGFQRLASWVNFLPGRDRMALDTHLYFCFGTQDKTPLASQLQKPCTSWGSAVNGSWSDFGVTTAGEWSLSINDCGYFLNGVGAGSRWDDTLVGYTGVTGPGAGACDVWNDWQNWNQTMKDQLKQFALASMDALQVRHRRRRQSLHLAHPFAHLLGLVLLDVARRQFVGPRHGGRTPLVLLARARKRLDPD
jgi:glucan 1,3-beta-glucosidase